MRLALKEYQSEALDEFQKWHDVLMIAKTKYVKNRIQLGRDGGSFIVNYPKAVWETIGRGQYRDRIGSDKEHIPHICLKVPTGGGKTLMAAAMLERVRRSTGLIIWIVPTKSIYHQTLKSLHDKDGMIRECLDRVSGNRVKVLKKDDSLTPLDIKQYLCIMVLMKQSADNRSKDFLIIHRDSGQYQSFFPDIDDDASNNKILEHSPHLDKNNGQHIKHSLMNIFKMQHPTIILDEAHKTHGRRLDDIISYVNNMSPSLIIELTATPFPKLSNILVNISGVALKKEEMIKMPINVKPVDESVSWEEVLVMAHDKLVRLDKNAEEQDEYIRPIMLIRVERTGSEHRDGKHIHAEDVREFLQNMSITSSSIAVKTSEVDEIGDIELMEKTSSIRYVITKNALQEGWDCPFAYILVILDKLKSKTAITQMLGRILRQPYQKYRNNKHLNQCYVYCRTDTTQRSVQYIKEGLENEGLGDLTNSLTLEDDVRHSREELHMRSNHTRAKIYLPKVLHKYGKQWIELDYERHILSEIKWDAIKAPDISDIEAYDDFIWTHRIDVTNLTTKGKINDDELSKKRIKEDVHVDKTLRMYDIVNIISETVPNKWHGSRIVQDAIRQARESKKSDDDIYNMRHTFTNRINEHVSNEVIKQAESIFKNKIKNKEIRFDLEIESDNFTMKKKYSVSSSGDNLLAVNTQSVQRSLFDPVYKEHFDTEPEKSFAIYLEEADAIEWWHRIAAKEQGEYYLRGWKKDRIWPDFVAVFGKNMKKRELHIYEIKGKHLDNPDTEYKKNVLEALEGAFNHWGHVTIRDGLIKGTFKMLFDNQIEEERDRLRTKSSITDQVRKS